MERERTVAAFLNGRAEGEMLHIDATNQSFLRVRRIHCTERGHHVVTRTRLSLLTTSNNRPDLLPSDSLTFSRLQRVSSALSGAASQKRRPGCPLAWRPAYENPTSTFGRRQLLTKQNIRSLIYYPRISYQRWSARTFLESLQPTRTSPPRCRTHE